MLVDTVGHVIEVTGSTQQPKVFTLRSLKQQAARVINAEDDREILATAQEGIRWAITYMNITRSFYFGRKNTAAAALTLNTNTVSLPSDFFGVRQVSLLYTANSITGPDLQVGDLATTIPYEPWEQFRAKGTDYGDRPIAWSAKNTFTDGVIYVRPTPKQKAVDDWTVQITYDTEISLPDSDTDVIAAPKDLTPLLVEGAKYFILFERKGDDPIRFRHQFAVFENMIARYGAHEHKRHGSKAAAWRIGEPS